MAKNCLVETTLSLDVEGTGMSEAFAVEQAFKAMRMAVQEQIPQPIVSIQLEACECLDKKTDVTQEAFLYFFFKREKVSVSVKLRMQLAVKTLDIGGDNNV